MNIEIGHIEAIYRYPVKSMAGERMNAADLGWHGVEGDRRLALRRTEDRSDFPWLTAGKLPAMIRYTPLGTHVRTPDGIELPVFSDELASDVARRYGAPLQIMHIRAGVFDDACVSIIAAQTMEEIARAADVPHDARRFRPNIVVRLSVPVCFQPGAFQEDAWVGRVLAFGDARVAVTMRDLRCAMVNLNPDTAIPQPQVMKSIVQMNENYAGVYGTVVHTGALAVGQPVFISPMAPAL